MIRRRVLLLLVLAGSVTLPLVRTVADDPKPKKAITVCCVPGGYAYHDGRECRTLRRSRTIMDITLTDAVKGGLLPCHVCNPAMPQAFPVTLKGLLADADKYDGRRVQVNGTADNGGPTFTLADGGDKIAVAIAGAKAEAPNPNDRVAVTGIFRKDAKRIEVTRDLGAIGPQAP